ncbi:oligopeptide transporter [Striga asiatica]|uniref:Oligopeptide transporter n=1 Tax=Striga asiatica TaxID=4170 RepID=A0A5A7QTR8_STRAF|nr:oligopeptide transporter [Striga asiatica]
MVGPFYYSNPKFITYIYTNLLQNPSHHQHHPPTLSKNPAGHFPARPPHRRPFYGEPFPPATRFSASKSFFTPPQLALHVTPPPSSPSRHQARRRALPAGYSLPRRQPRSSRGSRPTDLTSRCQAQHRRAAAVHSSGDPKPAAVQPFFTAVSSFLSSPTQATLHHFRRDLAAAPFFRRGPCSQLLPVDPLLDGDLAAQLRRRSAAIPSPFSRHPVAELCSRQQHVRTPVLARAFTHGASICANRNSPTLDPSPTDQTYAVQLRSEPDPILSTTKCSLALAIFRFLIRTPREVIDRPLVADGTITEPKKAIKADCLEASVIIQPKCIGTYPQCDSTSRTRIRPSAKPPSAWPCTEHYTRHGLTLLLFVTDCHDYARDTLYPTWTHSAAICDGLSRLRVLLISEIYEQYRTSSKGKSDIHTKLMKKYKDIPSWWFYILLALTVVISLALCLFLEKGNSDADLGPFACSFVCVLIHSSCQHYYRNYEPNPGPECITMYLMGMIYPGRPYRYMSMSQAVAFLSDFKLLKIPPRSIFLVQFVGTIVMGTVNVGVAWWLLHLIDGICHVPPGQGCHCG